MKKNQKRLYGIIFTALVAGAGFFAQNQLKDIEPRDAKGWKHGQHILFKKQWQDIFSTKRRDTVSITDYDRGDRHGTHILFLKNKRYYAKDYIRDKKDGRSVLYYPSGKIMSQTAYRDGIRQGAYTEYYPNGDLKVGAYYSKGCLVGQYNKYYPDFMLKEKSSYTNGQLNGVRVLYNPDRSIKSHEIYSNGLKKATLKAPKIR